jgi:ribosome biogenesis GTPase A
MAKSRNLPGVTKSLQWVRIGGRELEGLQENALELLDSPGIIPARQLDQEGALKLAICNDIGEASYDRVVVAAALCDRVNDLHRRCGRPSPPPPPLTSRLSLTHFKSLRGRFNPFQARRHVRGDAAHLGTLRLAVQRTNRGTNRVRRRGQVLPGTAPLPIPTYIRQILPCAFLHLITFVVSMPRAT